MTDEREQHLQTIKTTFSSRVDAKYRKGEKEHGGDLWTKNIVPLLDDEVTDFNVYWPTLRKQIAHLVSISRKVSGLLEETRYDLIREALNQALAPFLNDEVDPPEEHSED